MSGFRFLALSGLFLTLSYVHLAAVEGGGIPVPCDAQVWFSPKGGVTDAIVAFIDQAQHTIFVQAYGFTSMPIVTALEQARTRGVDIKVILDTCNNADRYVWAPNRMMRAGVPVVIDEKPKIAHNKVMIIDSNIVLTGSFNFTASAEHSNTENMVALRSPALAARYQNHWDSRWAVSLPFVYDQRRGYDPPRGKSKDTTDK